MMDQLFVDYFRKWKANGYSEDQIKLYLLKLNYPSQVIEEAAIASRIDSAQVESVQILSPAPVKKKNYIMKLIMALFFCFIISTAYIIVNSNLDLWHVNTLPSSPIWSNNDNREFSKPTNDLILLDTLNSYDKENLSIQLNIKDNLLYSKGFITYDGKNWQEFNIANQSIESWFSGNRVIDILLPASDINVNNTNNIQIALYGCVKENKSWNCHGNWQLSNITIDTNRSPEIQSPTRIVANSTLNQSSNNTKTNITTSRGSSSGGSSGGGGGGSSGGGSEQSNSTNNTIPVLISITTSPSCIRTGSINISTINATDADNDGLMLHVGTISGGSDLCNSTSGTSNRSCVFTVENFWTDTNTHTIYGRVDDAVNVSMERNITITTDNSGPNAPTNLMPTNNTATNNTTPNFNWSVSTDVGCNGTVSQYNITIYNNSACTIVVQSSFTPTNNYTATTLSNRTYYWNVKGRDGFNNWGTASACYNLTISNVSNSSASTRIFYISTTGNDSNNGTSISSPWKTVSKINGQTFSPGDLILFKKGDMWREQLNIPSSGNSTAPITFSSYGSGNDPIITGADNMTGFVNGGSNIWDKTGVTTEPNVVIKSGVLQTKVSSRGSIVSEGQWYWTGNNLSIYATSDPSGLVEAGQRLRVMDTQGKSYITFINLVFEGSNNAGSYLVYSGDGDVIVNNIFYNCTFQFSAGGGIRTGGTTSNTGMIFDGCVFKYNWLDGIFAEPNYDHYTNAIVSNSYFEKNGLNTTTEKNGLFGALGGWNVSNSEFYDNGRYGPVNNPLSHGIYGYLSNGMLYVTNCTAHGHNYGSGFRFRGSATITNCKSYDNLQAGYSFATHQTYNVSYTLIGSIGYNNSMYEVFKGYAASDAGTVNVTLYNNVFYHAANENYTDACYRFAGNIDNLKIRNNIAYSVNYDVLDSTYVISTTDIDYNLYYKSSGDSHKWRWGSSGSPDKTTLAAWQALGFDTHGNYSNPLFVNIGINDFHLNSSSPAIGAGVSISGITTDYDGVNYSSSPSIGAYEYVEALSTCNDTIMNGNETGIDCGGAQCESCSNFTRTFYVSNSGNDSNNGTSRESSWKTIAMINNQTFQSGDGILFERGNTWRETLIVNSSGNTTNDITFGAYSTGNKPKILGSTNVTMWTQDDILEVPSNNDLLNESFEGTGYENTWQETLNGGIVDEDYAGVTPPTGGGSQVLRFASSVGSTLHTLTNTNQAAYIDFYVMVNTSGLASGQSVYIYKGMDSTSAAGTYLALTNSSGYLKFSSEVYTDSQWPSVLYPDINTNAGITLNQWYHIQFSYDLIKNTYSCYIDGKLVISGILQGSCRNGTKKIFLGNSATTDVLYFDNLKISSTNFYSPLIELPSNVWKANLTTTPNSVWFVENGITKWGVQKTSIDNLSSKYDWYYGPNSLCTYSNTTNPDVVYTSVESATRMYGIDFNTKDYVTLNGLEVGYVRDYGMRLEYGTDYNIIDNCTIHHVGVIEVPVQEGIAIMGSHNIVRNSKISQCGRHAIYIFAGGNNAITDNLIENNEIYDNYYTGIDIKNLANNVSSGHIIRNNLFYCSSDGSYADIGTDTEGIVVGGDHLQTNISIYNNVMYNMFGIGIQLENPLISYAYIYNNIIYGTNPLNTLGYAAGIMVGSGDLDHIYVINNIAANVKNACFYLHETPTNSVIDYNGWYQNTTTDNHRFTAAVWGSYYEGDFLEWQTDTGYETHGFWENPLFVNATNYNFHLQPSSPARGAGLNISWITSDYDGHPYNSTNPSIGAFEYVP